MENNISYKLGARVLGEEEIKLSLPTYDKLLSQIEAVRVMYTVNKDNTQNSFTSNQVTNNFSILGPRGSGKSSVLKTLFKYLEKNKEENILLSPIVPENMEDGMTLMSTILGLLKTKLDSIVKENDINNTNNINNICCPVNKKIEIVELFDKLFLEFIYIQKSYQKVSIQEYSTDLDYRRNMYKIFESSNQFFETFQNFINEFIIYNTKNNNKNNPLIFIFIDDIDLSTNRCIEVVRTLLSYISHPKIVTILSGDIKIFEEALTLDFIRQENFTDFNFINEKYSLLNTEDNKTLLNTKKELSYEYLKKIMPPMYRHNLTNWPISIRGNFKPLGIYEEGTEALSLCGLLDKLSEKLPSLKNYFSIKKENNEFVMIPIMYHIFDSTSRGLINSYFAIYEMYNNYNIDITDENNVKNYQYIKACLETILSSNLNLSNYRDIIFNNFLQFSTNLKDVEIRFDNFLNWVEEKLKPVINNFKENDDNKIITDEIYNNCVNECLDIFRIFLYLDFSSNIFSDINNISYKNEEYNKIQKYINYIIILNKDVTNNVVNISKRVVGYIRNILLDNIYISYYDNIYEIILKSLSNMPISVSGLYYSKSSIMEITEKLWKLVNGKSSENTLERIENINIILETLIDYFDEDYNKIVNILNKCNELNEAINSVIKADIEGLLTSVVLEKYFMHKRSSDGKYTLSPLYLYYCFSVFEQKDNNENQTNNNIDFNGLSLEIFKDDEKKDNEEKDSEKNNKFNSKIKDELTTLIENKIDNISYSYNNFINNFDDLKVIEDYFLKKYMHINLEKTYYNLTIKDYRDYIFLSWLKTIQEGGIYTEYVDPFVNFYRNVFLKEILNSDNTFKNLSEINYNKENKEIEKNEKEEIKINFLKNIDKNNLWHTDIVKDELQDYLENTVRELEKNYLNENIKIYNFTIDISNAKDSYNKFKDCYKGISTTVSSKCQTILDSIINRYEEAFTCINLTEYIIIIEVLKRLSTSGAWYGVYEAKELLYELKKSEFKFKNNIEYKTDEFDVNINTNNYIVDKYKFYLLCYCKIIIFNYKENLKDTLILACKYRDNILNADLELTKEMIKQSRNDFAEKLGLNERELTDTLELFHNKKER